MSDNDTGVEVGTNTQEYPFSVKITQTAYGARVSVHAYAHKAEEAMSHALALYDSVRHGLLDDGYKVAPEEDPKPKKETNSK